MGSARARLGMVGATSAAVLMGVGSVIAKAADITGPVLALHRVWIAALLYLAIALGLGTRLGLDGLRVAAPGGFFFGLEVAFFFSSIQLTTVANATMLIALQPVVVLLFFSRRFGETVTARDLGLAVLAFGGVGLVVFGSSASPSWSPLGDLLGVGALITWTLYFVYSKQARRQLGAIEYQGLSLVVSSMVMLPLAVVTAGTVDPGPGKWWWILAMVATPGTGHLLMNWAHSRVSLAIVSELTLLSPVVSIALAAVVLDGESLNRTQIVGMAVVLATLAVMIRPRPSPVADDGPAPASPTTGGGSDSLRPSPAGSNPDSG